MALLRYRALGVLLVVVTVTFLSLPSYEELRVSGHVVNHFSKAAPLPIYVKRAPALHGEGLAPSIRWTTYTSPDGRVSFEYPSNLLIKQGTQQEGDNVLAFFGMANQDQSIQVTMIIRVSEALLPNWCNRAMDGCQNQYPNQYTTALTSREVFTVGDGTGFRQEFRELNGGGANEYIAVALDARPDYILFTSGYDGERNAELRPICERIFKSLRVKKP